MHSVNQEVTDGAAVLIATGPSLCWQQIVAAEDWREQTGGALMGVNDAYRMCSTLDHLYAADRRWVEHHRSQCNLIKAKKWGSHSVAEMDAPEWTCVQVEHRKNISFDREILHSGSNSGYQLINLAYLLGYRVLFLLGYDHHSGGQHFFGQHPTREMQIKSNYSRWVEHYDTIDAPDLTIVNCTPASSITAFPKMDLDDALDNHRRYHVAC